MKYNINGTGFIVAERDIYSLGGFIPKGKIGGKIASEAQLSQDGECWLASGDISGRPDIRIKDNAYVGDFVGATGIHTDGVTEFSGNTLVPGKIIVRNLVGTPINNFYAKDSFIGASMDVLCGPSTTATAFPFEQGGYSWTSPKGTLFSSMKGDNPNSCRSIYNILLGRDTYLYIPTGLTVRLMWGYFNTANLLAYSGEMEELSAGLRKLEHHTYKVCMVNIARTSALTPADLLATGTKILGHISRSTTVDIRPESASGQYVMDKSSFLMNTDNFGLNTTQLRHLAGGMYDTNVYTKTDRSDYKLYGTFRNVERLEYTKYLGDSHRTAATRDTYISAYDCPLLRVDDDTFDTSLMGTGDLVLRRCIVPKGRFVADPINGNTYEDIDFSYANEDLGFAMTGYSAFNSSHREGLYRVKAGTGTLGFVSHKGNLADTARLYQAGIYLPLDGSIMEQGAYGGGTQIPYESAKTDSPIRIRTGKPLATFGLIFPTLPAGYSVKALYYLDEDFVIRSTATDPTGIVTTYPYVVMLFRKDDDSAINVTDFIALNITLRIIDYTKVPEITGSAYVGAGCTVRGDVKLIGDPYVNRVLDVNMWERGAVSQTVGKSWEDSKISTTLGNRFRLMDTFPVEPGGLITCNSGYWVECGFFDSNGIFISSPGWGRTSNYAPAGAAYAGIVIKKSESASDAGGLITEGDIPLANVKYLRAFKKRRYIVNELDRTSPEDILLSVDYWEQGTAGDRQADAGKTYEELKATSGTTIRLKRPINVSPTSSISSASGFSRYIRVLDASTKFHLGESLASAKMALLAAIIQKAPSAAITPSEIANSRLVLEFVPQPRIIAPYGVSNVWIEGTNVRMYDNSVISRTITKGQEVTLKGDAVMGTVFIGDVCICSNGHDDAIIKRP